MLWCPQKYCSWKGREKKCWKIPAESSIPQNLHGAFKDITAFRQRLKLDYDQLQLPKAVQK